MIGRAGKSRAARRIAPASAALAFLAAALAGCLAGGGTDVGNPEFARVTGSLKNGDGSPAPVIALHLRTRDHLAPPDSLAPPPAESGIAQDRLTDSQGFFTFDSVPRGEYRIEAKDTLGTGALIDISVDGKTARIALDPAFLDRTGSLAGKINYLAPLPVRGQYPKVRIAAYGTDRATFATSDGSFILSDLPPGAYRLHVSSDTLSAEVPETAVTAGGRTEVGTVDLGP